MYQFIMRTVLTGILGIVVYIFMLAFYAGSARFAVSIGAAVVLELWHISYGIRRFHQVLLLRRNLAQTMQHEFKHIRAN